jgi:hypothetical protein
MERRRESSRCVCALRAGIVGAGREIAISIRRVRLPGNEGREDRMNNLTIVTKLRFVAALAPAILLLVAVVVAGALQVFGGTPRFIYNNQYAAARAANGMENALYKMDWGRSQPDGNQIVLDQIRRFIDWTETARAHISTPAQAEKIAKIAEAARPLFEAMRTAQPGDDTLEPKLRELDGLVADLISSDEASLLTLADSAESEAHLMIAITIVGAIVIPWICFVVIARLTSGLQTELKEIRRRVSVLEDQVPPLRPSDLGALDDALTKLGFPKPNPMLAE